MNKPQMKSTFGVGEVDFYTQTIHFWCESDIENYIFLYDFGYIEDITSKHRILHVDARYDFEEVYNYLMEVQKENKIDETL